MRVNQTIDQIWSEMNAAATEKKQVIIDRLLSNDTSLQSRKPNAGPGRLNDSDTTNAAGHSPKDVLNLSNDILQWTSLVISSKEIVDAVEDSDDDSEDEKEEFLDVDSITNTSKPNFHKIQRILNSLRSTCKNDRTLSLQSIEVSIKNLSKEFDSDSCIDPLDFPPPYDTASVAIKFQSSLVSDLSKESWPLWKQCQVPLSSQFRNFESSKRCGLKVDRITEGYGDQSFQILYDTFGGELCHRLSDESEQCRTLAIQCLNLICLSGVNLGKHLHYLMRYIICKFQPIFHDETLNVFVYHATDHEFFKRGGATQRQDRTRLLHGESFVSMSEGCEEIRFQFCHMISSIIRCSVHMQSIESLDPYIVDIFLAVQSFLSDPFPDLKVEAAALLVQLLRIPQFESVAKHLAVALARTVITNMRHRNAKVRISAMDLFEAAVSVPDQAKFKGAGSDAILDLLGYREENILPVAAFYKAECSVSVNGLAELSMDKNLAVRLRCCQMLCFILTCIPNRHEFHQRILPYMLTFHSDECADIRAFALSTVLLCGKQYESEHPDEIIERCQWGIDGDNRCNHQDVLPTPFTTRPPLGSRMFVRENSRRILDAALKELSNWIEKVRFASLKLLQVLVIYNEEHMTMNFHGTLEAITKAIQTILRERMDITCPYLQQLFDLVQLIGRFVAPDVYLNLILPRIVGDVSSGTSTCEGGFHPEIARYSNTLVLKHLIQGSSRSEVFTSYMVTIGTALLSDANIGHFTGSRVQIECLNIVITLLVGFEVIDTDLFEKISRDPTFSAISYLESLNHVLKISSNEQLPECVTVLVQRINTISSQVVTSNYK